MHRGCISIHVWRHDHFFPLSMLCFQIYITFSLYFSLTFVPFTVPLVFDWTKKLFLLHLLSVELLWLEGLFKSRLNHSLYLWQTVPRRLILVLNVFWVCACLFVLACICHCIVGYCACLLKQVYIGWVLAFK